MVEKIRTDPEVGKPLSYDLAGKRSLRISSFRIIYEYKDGKVILKTFDNRDKVY